MKFFATAEPNTFLDLVLPVACVVLVIAITMF